MIFYQDDLPRLIWSPEYGRVVVEFVGGTAEVVDQKSIALLLQSGYRHDPPDDAADECDKRKGKK